MHQNWSLPPPAFPDPVPEDGSSSVWGPEQQREFEEILTQYMSRGQTGLSATSQCSWFASTSACGQHCADFDALILHLANVHGVKGSAGRKLVCRWSTDQGSCNQEYRRDGFRRHIATHLGLSVCCPECGKSLSRADSIRAHGRKAHGWE